MLLFTDPSSINTDLLGGALGCPRPGCAGVLGPWGWARIRWVRVTPQRHVSHQPRRARCRACHRTHVLASLATYPRRVDSIDTVGAAVVAAAAGLEHLQVAELVGLPATTVRDWIRRARINAEDIRVIATTVEAVGRMLAAWTLRIGPLASPWQLVAALTDARLLAPPSRRRNAA